MNQLVLSDTASNHPSDCVNEQHALMAAIVASADDAIIGSDLNGNILTCNHAAEILFGYSVSAIYQRPVTSLFPAGQLPDHVSLIKLLQQGATIGQFETMRHCQDGTELPVALTISAIRDDGGSIIGLSLIARDFSIDYRIAAHPTQSERHFRQVVDAAPNAMIMIDSLGKIEMANAQTEQLFGYQREELLGQAMEILIPARFRPQHPGLRSSYFASPSTRAMGAGRDLFALRKDGSEFPVEISLNPIQTADGIKVLSAIVDITERKRITDELSRRNQELNSFAYVASHDLKSPLRGVDQLATWLTEDLAGKIDDVTNEHLRLMRVRIKRMERLLDDLLIYFRAGQFSSAPEHTDFAELVRNVFDQCCTDKAFRLELQGEFPRGHTFKVPLELVFRNLISNSIKHHDTRQGCIVVQAIPNDQWLEFAVCDDGPGIAPEHSERVFGMFQTLRPRDEVEGSGMGLAIIKKAIESLGGSIALSANHPRGAIFRFTWPRNTVEA